MFWYPLVLFESLDVLDNLEDSIFMLLGHGFFMYCLDSMQFIY